MRRSLVFFALLPLAACGTNATTATDDGGTVAPSPDLLAPVAGPADVSLVLTPFTLQPGEETIKCQYLPADGKERWLTGFTTDMNKGSHHLVVFRINEKQGKPTDLGPSPCTQVEIPKGFDGMLPGSQQLHTTSLLPDGVAMRFEAFHGLLFQEHFINATQQPITTNVKWSATSVDPASVKQHAGMIFYSNFDLNIPPGKSTASKSCKAWGDVNLITTTGHMHMHGLTFDATIATKNVFHTDNWDEPNGNIFASPGYAVKAGDPIAWTCAYDNQTGGNLVFGNSAVKNEMCIFASLFYPAPTPADEFQFGCTQ